MSTHSRVRWPYWDHHVTSTTIKATHEERVSVFIDGKSTFHGLLAADLQTSIDYMALGRLLCGDRQLVDVYYYASALPSGIYPAVEQAEKRILSDIQKSGEIILREGWMELFGSQFRERGVDVLLAMDVMESVVDDRLDSIVIVSGDTVFQLVARRVVELGKRVEQAFVPRPPHGPNCGFSDNFVPLSQEIVARCST